MSVVVVVFVIVVFVNWLCGRCSVPSFSGCVAFVIDVATCFKLFGLVWVVSFALAFLCSHPVLLLLVCPVTPAYLLMLQLYMLLASMFVASHGCGILVAAIVDGHSVGALNACVAVSDLWILLFYDFFCRPRPIALS